MWRRYLRALAHRDQARQHLEELEESIPDEHLRDWRDEEKQWQERVIHLQEDIDFDSPYELRKDNGEYFDVALSPLSHEIVVLSDKEILLKVTRERGLTGQTVASLIGVVQRGVALQMER